MIKTCFSTSEGLLIKIKAKLRKNCLSKCGLRFLLEWLGVALESAKDFGHNHIFGTADSQNQPLQQKSETTFRQSVFSQLLFLFLTQNPWTSRNTFELCVKIPIFISQSVKLSSSWAQAQGYNYLIQWNPVSY